MIIAVLVALALGVLFIVKFEKIDNFLFNKDNDSDYFGYGIESLFLSIIIGAIAGGASVLQSWFDWNMDLVMLYTFVILVLMLLICCALLCALAMEDSAQRTIGKFVFLAISVIVGCIMGVAGSVIILVLAILALVLMVISGALFGTGEKVQVKDSWGNKKTLTNSFGGEMRDSWGNAYEKDGNNYYKKD